MKNTQRYEMTFKDFCHTLQQSSIIATSSALQALPFSDVQRADVEFQPCHPSVETLLHRTLAWVDSSRQISMLVISWPTVTRGVADRLKCAKLTFCFSLNYVLCGQMWQSSLDSVQCPCIAAAHTGSSASPSPPSHDVSYSTNVWSLDTLLSAAQAAVREEP